MGVSLSVVSSQCGHTYIHTYIYISGCRSGRLDVVRYLVTEARCDPNVMDKNGRTPLHIASV